MKLTIQKIEQFYPGKKTDWVNLKVTVDGKLFRLGWDGKRFARSKYLLNMQQKFPDAEKEIAELLKCRL